MSTLFIRKLDSWVKETKNKWTSLTKLKSSICPTLVVAKGDMIENQESFLKNIICDLNKILPIWIRICKKTFWTVSLKLVLLKLTL